MNFFKQLTDPALKRLYKFVLKRLIGRFLAEDEIDLDQLDVHLRSGRLELCDLRLNTDVLNADVCEANGLPFRVKKGYLGSVRVTIAYANIMSESCLVEIDDIEIVLVPVEEAELGNRESETSSARPSASATPSTLEKKNEVSSRTRAPSREQIDEVSQEGLDFVASWIEQVMSKIKVTLSNICLRIETGDMTVPNSKHVALLCKLEWAQFTDESASEVASVYGTMADSHRMGASQSMYQSMAASSLFGISQKAVKFRGISMDLLLPSENIGGEDSDAHAGAVLHPFLASDSTRQCYVQLKLSHYEALEAPSVDADIFLHSIRVVLQPQHFEYFGVLIDTFSDEVVVRARSGPADRASAMYASICDTRPAWLNDDDDDQVAAGSGGTDEASLKLSFREFQRIEQILHQYHKTHTELANATRNRMQSPGYDYDVPYPVPRRLSIAESVESAGLSDLDDDESFFDCDAGATSMIGGESNLMAQSMYASALYDVEETGSVSGSTTGLRSSLRESVHLRGARSVRNRVKLHLLETDIVILYDDLPDHGDEEEPAYSESRQQRQMRRRRPGLPVITNEERLEVSIRDVIITVLLYPTHVSTSVSVGKLEVMEKIVARMSTDTDHEDGVLLSTNVLHFADVSPVTGRSVHLSSNISAQVRVDLKPDGQGVSGITVQVSTQPIILEWDMHILDRAHRLMKLIEDSSAAKQKKLQAATPRTLQQYPKKLDVNTECVEIALRFPLVNSDLIRFGPSSRRGLSEDKLIILLDGVKVSSHEDVDEGESPPARDPIKTALPWLAEFEFKVETVNVSLIGPKNGNQRSNDPVETASIIAARSDSTSGDSCAIRLRLQTPTNEQVRRALTAKQSISQDSLEQYLEPSHSSNGVSSDSEEKSGDENDGGRIGTNGWSQDARLRAHDFEASASAAALMDLEILIPHAKIVFNKRSFDRLMILSDALLMINPIDINGHNQMMASGAYRNRLIPSYMSMNLVLRDGMVQLQYSPSKPESTVSPAFVYHLAFQDLKIFQVSQWMGQLVSRVQISAQNVSLIEEDCEAKHTVPVLYKNPVGQNDAPIFFVGIDIIDQTQEMREMKVELHVSQVNLRHGVTSKWMFYLSELLLLEYPPPVIPLDSAYTTDDEYHELLQQIELKQYEAVRLAVPPKTIFTKLFVSFYDAMVDYSPPDLPSRLLLVLGNISVSSNVVTGALIQGYKIALRDVQLLLTPERSPYDEIDQNLLGNELFSSSRRLGKHLVAGENRSRGQLASAYPSMLIYFEKNGFLQMVTMDFVDLFLRAIVPPAADDGRQYTDDADRKKVTPASLGTPELSVELNLGTANIYACFDSFNTLLEVISDWTEQLNLEDEPRDTTAYVGLDRIKDVSSVSVTTNLGPATVRSSRPSSEDPSPFQRNNTLLGDESELRNTAKGRAGSTSRTDSASVTSGSGVNLFSLLDENAFGADRRGQPSGHATTDTEARLLRTRLDAIQREKNRIVNSGASAPTNDDSLSAAELRRKYNTQGDEKPAKPRIRIDELFIEDYYAGNRTGSDARPSDAGNFLLSGIDNATPPRQTEGDPWFASPPTNPGESSFPIGGGHPVGSLPEEHTARWLNPAAHASSPRVSSPSSSPRFDPVEEEFSHGFERGLSTQDASAHPIESPSDEEDEDDDVFPMGAFPAGSKNWWGMSRPQDVELSELQTEETGSSFSHRFNFDDGDASEADDHADTPAHMSMSMIGTGIDSGTEVELDFDVDGEMQANFKRLLEMETSDALEDEDSDDEENLEEQQQHLSSPRARIGSYHQDASAPIPILNRRTSASENSTHSGTGAIISPPDEPTARWFYDDAAGDSHVRDGPPSRIYPHHVEIPIGGTAASLSFGERECDEAIRSVARENSARHVASTPVVIRHVLLRDFNICMRFFGGSDWSRDLANAPTLSHRGVVQESHSSIPANAANARPGSASATDRKKKLLDSLLDDYVPSAGKTDLFGTDAGDSSLFGGRSPATEQRTSSLPGAQPAQRKRSLRSGRKTEEMLELVVTRIQLRLDVFNDEESQPLASNTVLALGDIEILDYISTSQIRKIICYWKSDASHPRESGSSMVHVHLMTVRPGPNLCEEHRLKVRLLPLRINLDQEVVSFLRQFVPTDITAKPSHGMEEDSVDDDGVPEADGTELSSMSASPAPSRVMETDVSLGGWFFQSIEIRPCKIKIDYRPNRVDFQALRAGDYLEVINLFVLEGMELVLRRVKASGIDGWAALGEHVLMSWVSDISRHQIHKCVASVAVPPLRPFANIGSGAADLILLPLQQYDRDRRVVRGLKKGAKSFLKSVTIETLNTVSKVAQGTQALLEHADDVVSTSATRKRNIKYRQPGSRIARNSKRMGGGGIRSAQDRGGIGSRQYLAQQPSNATEGLYQAYDSLSRELHTAAKTIVAVPLVEYKKTGSQGYVRSVIRAVPVAVLRPMIGATEAMSKALIGVRNAVDPEMKEDVENKFKDFRTI